VKVYAQIHNPIFGDSPPAEGGREFISKFITFLIKFFLVGGVLLFLIYFIIGAYKWITSQGDKNKIQEAQKTISYAVIGLTVVFMLFVIIKLVGTVFGIEALKNLKLIIPTL
jgi:cytochrome bd-type quinol oxidase subunit 2